MSTPEHEAYVAGEREATEMIASIKAVVKTTEEQASVIAWFAAIARIDKSIMAVNVEMAMNDGPDNEVAQALMEHRKKGLVAAKAAVQDLILEVAPDMVTTMMVPGATYNGDVVA